MRKFNTLVPPNTRPFGQLQTPCTEIEEKREEREWKVIKCGKRAFVKNIIGEKVIFLLALIPSRRFESADPFGSPNYVR